MKTLLIDSDDMPKEIFLNSQRKRFLLNLKLTKGQANRFLNNWLKVYKKIYNSWVSCDVIYLSWCQL